MSSCCLACSPLNPVAYHHELVGWHRMAWFPSPAATVPFCKMTTLSTHVSFYRTMHLLPRWIRLLPVSLWNITRVDSRCVDIYLSRYLASPHNIPCTFRDLTIWHGQARLRVSHSNDPWTASARQWSSPPPHANRQRSRPYSNSIVKATYTLTAKQTRSHTHARVKLALAPTSNRAECGAVTPGVYCLVDTVWCVVFSSRTKLSFALISTFFWVTWLV